MALPNQREYLTQSQSKPSTPTPFSYLEEEKGPPPPFTNTMLTVQIATPVGQTPDYVKQWLCFPTSLPTNTLESFSDRGKKGVCVCKRIRT